MCMAYNTSVKLIDLEVQYKYYYDKDMGEWRTSGELDDVVIAVGCTLSANWNGSHIHTMNAMMIDINPPSPAGFKPLSALTEDDCQQFLFATERYWSLMSVVTGQVYESRQAPTQGLCALPWEQEPGYNKYR